MHHIGETFKLIRYEFINPEDILLIHFKFFMDRSIREGRSAVNFRQESCKNMVHIITVFIKGNKYYLIPFNLPHNAHSIRTCFTQPQKAFVSTCFAAVPFHKQLCKYKTTTNSNLLRLQVNALFCFNFLLTKLYHARDQQKKILTTEKLSHRQLSSSTETSHHQYCSSKKKNRINFVAINIFREAFPSLQLCQSAIFLFFRVCNFYPLSAMGQMQQQPKLCTPQPGNHMVAEHKHKVSLPCYTIRQNCLKCPHRVRRRKFTCCGTRFHKALLLYSSFTITTHSFIRRRTTNNQEM